MKDSSQRLKSRCVGVFAMSVLTCLGVTSTVSAIDVTIVGTSGHALIDLNNTAFNKNPTVLTGDRDDRYNLQVDIPQNPDRGSAVLIKFDLSAYQGGGYTADGDSTVRLYKIFGSSGGGASIYEVLADWDQTTVTSAIIGDAQIGDNLFNTGSIADGGGFVDFTVPADVINNWLDGDNYGVALRLNSDWGNIEWRNQNHVNAGTTGYANLDLSLTAVPEPSTYALFLGISALGFLLVRRRQS